ncbi:MAG: UdgX family uracil-DNA binding protein [Alphaproteobacteria bacterium]|nr:UdgX family uracil-DNA binding protein [Alphaproteobacteria bacterium]
MTLYAVPLPVGADTELFRNAAKGCVGLGLSPDKVAFQPTGHQGFLPEPPWRGAPAKPFTTPRAFLEHMEEVACHNANDRFDLLYALIWRFARGEIGVMDRAEDITLSRTLNYARAVRRDIHKMHAFVRFREHYLEGKTLFVAWFEPLHHILHKAAPFFVDRFPSMDWLIATPLGAIGWKDGILTFGPGGTRPPDTDDGVLDIMWATYYRTIFNPARLHVDAMRREMPKRYWRNMPETKAVPELLRRAEARAGMMIGQPGDATPTFADRIAARRAEAQALEDAMTAVEARTIGALRKEADGCTRCPLYRHATQTVFGEGPSDAEIMFVGEQPGDQEDLAGKPFVGPAGQKFNAALEQAGIERTKVYVTNAVKHFKYEPRGKRRIHAKPNGGEIQACRFWLEREIALVKPSLIVALGATAAQSLAGRTVAIMKERGKPTAFGEHHGLITVHPSFLLRLPDAEDAEREFGKFVADLKLARQLLGRARAA